MDTNKFKISNGLISCAVFAMVTVAVIAGQAKDNLKPVADRSEPPQVGLPLANIPLISAEHRLDTSELRRLDALPMIVNTLLDVPIQIEVNLVSGHISVGRRQTVTDSE